MRRDYTKRVSRRERELISHISIFLLKQEALRNQFWTVKSAEYKADKNELKIGISSITGKLGTTLLKLKTVARPLSEELFAVDLVNTYPRISFFVDKRDQEIEKMYNLLDNIPNSPEPKNI